MKNHLGAFASASVFPNVAGSSARRLSLQAGDLGFDIATGTLLVCTDPTVGAAVWAVVGIEAIGMSNFVPTAGGNYLQRDDAGVSLPTLDEMTEFVHFRLNAIPTATERVISKDDGTPGRSLALTTTGLLQYRAEGTTLVTCPIDVGDVGASLIVAPVRSTAGDFLWLLVYNAATNSVRIINRDRGLSAVTAPSTQSFAIGARRGDNIGGDEASSCTIIGYAYVPAVLTLDQIESVFQETAAQGDLPLTIPSATHLYRASTVHADSLGRDLIGTDHLAKVENSGSLTLETFIPQYRAGEDEITLFLGIGASNMEGRNTLASVPAAYVAPFAGATLWVDSEAAPSAVSPRGDNDWGQELSSTREAVANGVENLFYYKLATSGAGVDDEWNIADASSPFGIGNGANVVDLFIRFIEGTGTTPHPFSPWAKIALKCVVFTDGAASATSAPAAAAYLGELTALVDYLKEKKGLWLADPDYIFITSDVWIGLGGGYPERDSVSADNYALAASRSDVAVVGTDDLSDNGDGTHFNPQSEINIGIAAETARVARANTVAAAA